MKLGVQYQYRIEENNIFYYESAHSIKFFRKYGIQNHVTVRYIELKKNTAQLYMI